MKMSPRRLLRGTEYFMKQILLYGDSITWGFDPDFKEKDHLRFERDSRWGGIAEKLLGEDCRIVEEGLSGRTTSLEDPAACGKNGLSLLIPILQSHQPLDLVVFLLGTNDMKNTYHASVPDIRRGMELLIKTVLTPFVWDTGKPPKILLIAPPHIHDRGVHDFIDGNSEAKSLELGEHYRLLAKDYGCNFLDASRVTEPSAWEGVHLDREGQRLLGKAAAAKIREILEQER